MGFVRSLALLLVGVLAAVQTLAADVRVFTSGAFTSALKELAPQFEQESGHKVLMAFGASMGNAPDSIPSRLDRNEPVDLVILAADALDELARQGKVVAGSRTDLVRSEIGLVVRSGAPRPDIGTVEALKRTLLNAKSVAYSSSASGAYYAGEMLKKLGLHDEVMPKSRRIVSERVAAVVARGEAEIGFQQVSELVNVPGADFVGVIPPDVQRVTVFSAGLAGNARESGAARELVRFLTSQAAVPTIRKAGLAPAF